MMKGEMDSKPIAILGAGAWGTALAIHLAKLKRIVHLWSIDKAEIDEMSSTRISRYLPGFALSPFIHPTLDISSLLSDIEDILIAVPSIGYRSTLTHFKKILNPHSRIICATKGLDEKTGKLLHEVTVEILDKNPFAVLSGPSFAREVAAGLPTSVIIASQDSAVANSIKQSFESPVFSLYPTNDIVGVEIGGILKNVIAIATGISDGAGFATNARSALITKGLSEIILLGSVLGGKIETFVGLAGVGDLILTCSDDQSRNRRLGLAIGKGEDPQEAEQIIGHAVEGKRNAEWIVKLAKQYNVHLPICETVWNILQGKEKASALFKI